MMHRALLYCRYTEFYQLLCVSEMSSWFSVQSWKALGFRWWWEPGQDLRVLIMSIINIFHFQVALVCLPLRDVSAESRAGLGSLVSLIFYCFPTGKGRKSCPVLLLMRFIFFFPQGQSSVCPALIHKTKLLPFLWSNKNIFRKYKALLSLLRNWKEFMIPIYFWSTNTRTSWVKC